LDEPLLDRAAIAETFLAEADEIVGAMEGELVALGERPDDAERLDALFRAAHTLKGGAALAGFDPVRELAHALEDVLERLRDRSLPVTDALVTLLLGSVDVLREALAARDAAEGPPSVAAFRARLAAAASAPDGGAPEGSAPVARAPGAAPAASPAPGVAARTVRVTLSRLDRLLDTAGELAVARGRLTELLEAGPARLEEALSAHRDADRLWLELQQLVMESRMVPIGPSLHALSRVVRDVSVATGRQARLVVEGEDVEVDASVVEHVRDPLNHMVRNAVAHGVEPPEVRAARGKPPCGLVTVRARTEPGFVAIDVQDDGAGLDRAALSARARALGLPVGAGDDVLRLVFVPGLSTSAAVTEVSGRGVGMDVVRRNVEALRGSVGIASVAGRGTTFTLRLPLTLAIVQGFRVRVAGEVHLVPLEAVEECAAVPRDALREGAAVGVLTLRGAPLPALRLRARFGAAGAVGAENVLVVRHGALRAGLVVDGLLGECQAVVKPLGAVLRGTPGFAGASILGDGRVAMLLDVPALLDEAVARSAAEAGARPAPGEGSVETRREERT
jgi:two-component system chemotaxis sensor kinase CheA